MSTGDAGSLDAAFNRVPREVRRVLESALAGAEVSPVDADGLVRESHELWRRW